MTESNSKMPANVSESTTVTIVGVSNLAPADSRELPTYSVTSYTAPSESLGPSRPLSEGAVRLGNSLLNANVPESAIRRDTSTGDF